jgi:hypothetical protein
MAVYSEKDKLEKLGLSEDFEELKSYIYLRLFNKENLPFDCNINSVPHRTMLDCAITYCVQQKTYIDREKGVNCYLIKNEDIERWDVSIDELHNIAYENTRQKNNARVETLQKHVSRYHILSPINELSKEINFSCDVSPSNPKRLRHTLFENAQYGQMPMQSNINLTRFIQSGSDKEEDVENLLIISNRNMNFGAVNMFFSDVTDKVYETFDEDFYMLPLSIHEILCVRKSFANRDNDNFRETEEDLLDMVEQINDHVLSKTFDILSYNIYLHIHGDNCTFMIK